VNVREKVCLCEREERVRERDQEREKGVCVCVCEFVCARAKRCVGVCRNVCVC